MSNLIDADAGTERFGGYEAELKLVQADLSQQIEQIKESTGEPRKAAISRAERALEEAEELVSWSLYTPVAHTQCSHALRHAYPESGAMLTSRRPPDWPNAPGKVKHTRQPQVQLQRALPQLRARPRHHQAQTRDVHVGPLQTLRCPLHR